MAGLEPSTTRRALLGAAAAIPIAALAPHVRPEPVEGRFSSASCQWNERLARYHRLAERAKTAAETGWFRAANDRYYREAVAPGTDRKAAFARVSRAEDLYWRRCTAPVQKAAVTLVLTPVPTVEALRAKIATIRTHQLHELDSMTRDTFEILEEDVRRLSIG